MNYADRLKKSNIVGSYKLINHPVYRHAYKAYLELMKRVSQEKRNDQGSELNLGVSSQVHFIPQGKKWVLYND